MSLSLYRASASSSADKTSCSPPAWMLTMWRRSPSGSMKIRLAPPPGESTSFAVLRSEARTQRKELCLGVIASDLTDWSASGLPPQQPEASLPSTVAYTARRLPVTWASDLARSSFIHGGPPADIPIPAQAARIAIFAESFMAAPPSRSLGNHRLLKSIRRGGPNNCPNQLLHSRIVLMRFDMHDHVPEAGVGFHQLPLDGVADLVGADERQVGGKMDPQVRENGVARAAGPHFVAMHH